MASLGQVTSGEQGAEEVPEGMRSDARETWPSQELIASWLGDAEPDFELRPGEQVEVAEDPAAQAAARHFRDVLGRFASGVTVITAVSGGAPVGMTCQSFSSASLDPPLVLFLPARTSRAWPQIQRAGRFCVNFLAADQAAVSNQMASRGADKFAGIGWSPSPATGSPILHGSLAHVDCAVHAVHEAGDHFVVLGRVLALEVAEDREQGEDGEPGPLVFYRGEYRTAR